MDSNDIFDQLTEALGGFINEVTGRPVLLGREGVWNKPKGEFVLVDLQSAEPTIWSNNEGYDENGNPVQTHNFVVTYLITAFRGNTHSALSKAVQLIKSPYKYYKYFPTDSPFAFSSSSSVSRTRVPLEEQVFENQSSVILYFNVCFIEQDESFEDLIDININGVVKSPGLPDINFQADVNTPDTISAIDMYILVNEDLPVDGKSTWINLNN